jgi:GT2 family glycosyltransferase
MNSDTDISVIVVSWNAKRYLLECLESLTAQRPTRTMETIVVDNGSSDGSPEMVHEKFPGVSLIENGENLGFAKANNIGIRNSKGRYVCLVNSDVKVLESTLDRLCDFMDQNPRVGIVGPKVFWPNGTLQDSCRTFPSLWNNICSSLWLSRVFPKSRFFSGEHMTYFPHDKVCKVDSLVGAFLMVRREAIEQVGLLDEQFFIYYEEVDWCKRFWNKGWQVVFYPDAEIIHYGRASSSNSPLRFSLEQQGTQLQYWKKHHGRAAQIGIVLIIFLRHVIRLLVAALDYLMRPSKRNQAVAAMTESRSCLQRLFSLHGSAKSST